MKIKTLTAIFVILWQTLLLLNSCTSEVRNPVTFIYDPNTVPMVSTDSVEMLISDSGIVRYKKIASLWQIFDKVSDPHWYYPEGIYVEQYDSLFNIIATIEADTAWNYTRRKVWELHGNVKMKNTKGETYTSQELIWDENTQKVYSNTYVVIHQPGNATMRAYGFEANQQMTYYQFRRAEDVDLYVSDSEVQTEEKQE